MFQGDSRLRYLFAAMLDLLDPLGLLSESMWVPHHRACPFGNPASNQTAVDTCRQYYKCGGEFSSVALQLADVAVDVFYVPMLGAHQRLSLTEVMNGEARNADVIIVDNGLWQSYYNFAGRSNTTLARNMRQWASPPCGPETHADQLMAFDALAAEHSNAVRIAMGTEHNFRMAHDTKMRLQRTGWLVAEAPWAPQLKGSKNVEGTAVWAPGLLPKRTNEKRTAVAKRPHVARYEQIDGPHIFDTAGDLEVQLLLNSICPVLEALPTRRHDAHDEISARCRSRSSRSS